MDLAAEEPRLVTAGDPTQGNAEPLHRARKGAAGAKTRWSDIARYLEHRDQPERGATTTRIAARNPPAMTGTPALQAFRLRSTRGRASTFGLAHSEPAHA